MRNMSSVMLSDVSAAMRNTMIASKLANIAKTIALVLDAPGLPQPLIERALELRPQGDDCAKRRQAIWARLNDAAAQAQNVVSMRQQSFNNTMHQLGSVRQTAADLERQASAIPAQPGTLLQRTALLDTQLEPAKRHLLEAEAQVALATAALEEAKRNAAAETERRDALLEAPDQQLDALSDEVDTLLALSVALHDDWLRKTRQTAAEVLDINRKEFSQARDHHRCSAAWHLGLLVGVGFLFAYVLVAIFAEATAPALADKAADSMTDPAHWVRAVLLLADASQPSLGSHGLPRFSGNDTRSTRSRLSHTRIDSPGWMLPCGL
jgi:small-conductance mechanosensitive channel